MTEFWKKLITKDKWHTQRQARAYARGWLATRVFRLLSPHWSFGRRLRCYAWPTVTYIRGALHIGDDVRLGQVTLAIAPSGSVRIGARSSINDYSVVASGYSIEIGSDVMIAEQVSIRDYDHGFERIDLPMNQQGFPGAPIVIEDDVWIGRGVAVLKGVTIGRGAIVGANAVVVDDVPPLAIVGGIPARVLRIRSGNRELRLRPEVALGEPQ